MSNISFVPKDQKVDKILSNGQSIERLSKNEDFKIFMDEVSLRRQIALQKYITSEANEALRQIVITLDEVMDIPRFFIKQMEVSMLFKHKGGSNGPAVK